MPATIHTTPSDNGTTAYIITGRSCDDVQCAIFAVMEAALAGLTGAAHFENPKRSYSMTDAAYRWRSRGFVEVAQP